MFFLDVKHFPEIMKKLEISYYLLIITNLVLKILYILFRIFVFQFHPLEFDFYTKFGSHFMIVICFFLFIFLIEIFIYQI